MNILFFKLGAIGDTLMTTPLVRQVRKAYPKARIDYLIGNHSAGVLKGNNYLSNIIPFDEHIILKKEVKQWILLVKRIRKEKYDLIFVLDKHWIFNLTAFFFGIKMRVGFDRAGKEGIFLTHKVRYESVRHESLYYLDLAKACNIPADEKDFFMDIAISKKEKAFAKKFFTKNKLKKDVIGICPGGGVNPGQQLDQKIWPVEKYIALIKKIKKQVLLLGGKSDCAKEELILKECKNVISVVGKTNLQESAALMQRCVLVICNDSGPMHIAAASGTKVISIFGPTDPRRLHPLGAKHTYIWKHTEPCYTLYGKMLQKNHVCLEDISPKDVLELLFSSHKKR